MDKPIVARYAIGTITTRDLELYKRSRRLQEDYTIESIFRRGVEEIEQDMINNLTQNNNA